MDSTITTTTIWVIQVEQNGNWIDCGTITSSEDDAIAERDEGNAEDGPGKYQVIRRVQTNEDTLI